MAMHPATHPTLIEYGRLLVEIGTALLQGKLQLTDSITIPPLGTILNSELNRQSSPVASDSSVVGAAVDPHERYIPPTSSGRPNARGGWTARKGYHVSKPKGGKPADLKGVTPAGVRLLEYVQRNPGQSAATIAGDLGLARKTVENLLSSLRQRNLIETGELTLR
jgi:hypothetical protein